MATHLFEVVLSVCFRAKTRRMETLMRTDKMKIMMRTVPRTQGRTTSLMSSAPSSMTSIWSILPSVKQRHYIYMLSFTSLKFDVFDGSVRDSDSKLAISRDISNSRPATAHWTGD